MDALPRSWVREKVLDALTGLQLGVLGGALMLVWYALLTPVLAQSWWILPNLFASKYYSARAVRSGAGMPTISGIALHLVSSGVVGAVGGFLAPGTRLVGVGTAVAWYALSYLMIWKRVAPALLDYAPQAALASGFFFFAAALGFHPEASRIVRRIAT